MLMDVASRLYWDAISKYVTLHFDEEIREAEILHERI
jgi:hypothetical protein